MTLLLDTHVLLWYTLADARLSQTAKSEILNAANQVLISPASYWEIAVKISIGKLSLHRPYHDFMDACLKTYGFTVLPIEPKHTETLIALPFHHKDPFDRLIIAQAITEGIPIVTGDAMFSRYAVNCIF